MDEQVEPFDVDVEDEIRWCIKRLETITSQKLPVQKAKKYSKALKTLRNSKAPLPKKRQVMSMTCDGYRKSMQEEMKISQSSVPSSGITSAKGCDGVFLKRAANNISTTLASSSQTGNTEQTSNFKFNFTEPMK